MANDDENMKDDSSHRYGTLMLTANQISYSGAQPQSERDLATELRTQVKLELFASDKRFVCFCSCKK